MISSRPRRGLTRIGVVTVASIVGQAPAVAVPVVMAWRFGASACSDALFLAMAVATFVVTSVLAIGQTAVVPFLVDAVRAEHGVAAVLPAVRRTTLWSLAVVGLVGTLVALTWFPPSEGCAAGWPAYLAALAPYVAAAAFCGLATAALNAHRDYTYAAVSPIVRWTGVILGVALFAPWLGLWAAPLGFGAGELARWGALEWRRISHRVPSGATQTAPELSLVGTAVAQVAGSALLALAPMIDRLMAARALDAGSVSILEYVERIWQVPVGLAVSGLLVVALSEWSHHRSAGASISALAAAARRMSLAAGGLALVATAVVVLGRRAVVAVLFRHAALDPHTLDVASDTLAAIFLATPIYVAGLTYGRALLVLKRSDWLLVAAVCQLGVKVMANLWLMPRFGLPGIGLSTALMYAVGSVILIAVVHATAMRARLIPELHA